MRIYKTNRGFTFIETIVVLGTMGIIMPALFGIVFSILRQEIRILRIQQLKREGDLVYNTIKDKTRNDAIKIANDSSGSATSERCVSRTVYPTWNNTSPNSMYFRTKSNTWFTFTVSGNRINFNNNGTVTPVNSVKTIMDSTFRMSCQRSSDFSPPLISIQYTIRHADDPSLFFNYSTKIKLRNQ